MAKQYWANPLEFGDLEACFMEKKLHAADVIRTMWVAMHNSAKVDWLTCQHCNGAMVNWEGVEDIH